jgi:hypothetical protein
MPYTEDRFHLVVAFDAKGCSIPRDEQDRMEVLLIPLRQAVSEIPSSHLSIGVIHHPKNQVYHVEFKLKTPSRTLFADAADAYLDSAFQRGLDQLLNEVRNNSPAVNGRADATVAQRLAMDAALVAPEDPSAGALAATVLAGDYRAFRTALSGYEDWLGKRIGRWVQRFPEVEARIGGDLRIGDIVEEVYLNAFEQLTRRPTGVRFSDWLVNLIDPSIKSLLRRPDMERENASLGRTVRDLPPTDRH